MQARVRGYSSLERHTAIQSEHQQTVRPSGQTPTITFAFFLPAAKDKGNAAVPPRETLGRAAFAMWGAALPWFSSESRRTQRRKKVSHQRQRQLRRTQHLQFGRPQCSGLLVTTLGLAVPLRHHRHQRQFAQLRRNWRSSTRPRLALVRSRPVTWCSAVSASFKVQVLLSVRFQGKGDAHE